MIDGLNEAQQNNDKLIGPNKIEEYLYLWQDHDTEQTFTLSILDCFYFIAELGEPFITEKDMISNDIETFEPGWLINKEKGYKVKAYSLFKILDKIQLEVHFLPGQSKPVVKFEELTKSMVFRVFSKDKESNILNILQNSLPKKEG